MTGTTNPYKTGDLVKPKFYYPSWAVRITMLMEDAGIWKIVHTDKHPSFADGAVNHSLGLPLGLSDNAIYVVAFSSLLFAIFKFYSTG